MANRESANCRPDPRRERRTCTQSSSGEVGKREGAQAKPLRHCEPWPEALADSRYLVSSVAYIGAEILVGTNTLLHSGPFLLPALTGRISPIRPFRAWLLLPLLWKFVAFHRGIPSSSAFENFQSFGAIATATPFPKILLGTQSRNLFRHCHIDELV